MDFDDDLQGLDDFEDEIVDNYDFRDQEYDNFETKLNEQINEISPLNELDEVTLVDAVVETAPNGSGGTPGTNIHKNFDIHNSFTIASLDIDKLFN